MTRVTPSRPLFRETTIRAIAGKPHVIVITRCSHTACTKSIEILRPRMAHSHEDKEAITIVHRRLESEGWTANPKDLARAKCPEHSRKPARESMEKLPPMTPIPIPMTPSHIPSAIANIVPSGILPPRQPTPAERRRVLERIEDQYDTVSQRYRGSATDQSISTILDVPRAWVTEIRSEFFGPERNEVDARYQQTLDALDARAIEMERIITKLMEDHDKLAKDIGALKTGRK